jgi:hypothetical protein
MGNARDRAAKKYRDDFVAQRWIVRRSINVCCDGASA